MKENTISLVLFRKQIFSCGCQKSLRMWGFNNVHSVYTIYCLVKRLKGTTRLRIGLDSVVFVQQEQMKLLFESDPEVSVSHRAQSLDLAKSTTQNRLEE